MRRTILSLTAAAAVAGIAATGAWAHSKSKTEPEDGATVETLSEVVMRFDRPMRVTLVRLTRGGEPVEVERNVGMVPVTEFVATPASGEPGAYTVEWRGLSADGHPMNGTFSFTVAE